MKRPATENALLLRIRSGQPMTARQQLYLTAQLSLPSIMAQISSITMQYIDAAMVAVSAPVLRRPSGSFRPQLGCSWDYVPPYRPDLPYR